MGLWGTAAEYVTSASLSSLFMADLAMMLWLVPLMAGDGPCFPWSLSPRNHPGSSSIFWKELVERRCRGMLLLCPCWGSTCRQSCHRAGLATPRAEPRPWPVFGLTCILGWLPLNHASFSNSCFDFAIPILAEMAHANIHICSVCVQGPIESNSTTKCKNRWLFSEKSAKFCGRCAGLRIYLSLIHI